MGTKLTGQPRENTPVVAVTRKVDGYFVGILGDKGREVKMRRGKGNVYSFQVEDTDFPTELKTPEGKYIEAIIDIGAKVCIFAPKVLHEALQGANVGDKIKLVYLGKVQGQNADYHNFDVEKI